MKHLKNALLGIALAVVAAYLYFVMFFMFLAVGLESRLVFTSLPFVAIFYSSWIIIPLGAALGMLVPQIAVGKSRLMAALQGAAIGAGAGLISTVCLVSAYNLRLITGFVILTVTAYSALWVGAYAFCRAKGQSIYR